jgi:hypothetical protein
MGLHRYHRWILMKRIFTILFFLSSLICSAQHPLVNGWSHRSGGVTQKSGAVVVVTMGQSNEVGRASPDAGNEVTVPSGCYFFKTSDNSVVALADPVGEGPSIATDRSLQPNMAKRVKELTGRDIYVIKKSLGNTNIKDWIGSYADDAITAYNSFVTYAAAHSIEIGYVFIHWLQGENDAGLLDADGYLAEQDRLINYVAASVPFDAWITTRIGYDPSFTSSANSEQIMKAQTAYNYITTAQTYILSTNQTATFTSGNGKMKTDNVHYTVIGQNEVGGAVADAINQWIVYNTKVTLPSEPVSALSGISGNTSLLAHYEALIAGPWDWDFEFGSAITEAEGDVTAHYKNPDDIFGGDLTPTYDANGIVLDKSGGIFVSKKLELTTATIEFRCKTTAGSGYVLGVVTGGTDDMVGGFSQKILIERDYDNGYGNFYFPNQNLRL